MTLFLLVLCFMSFYNCYFLSVFMIARVPGNKYTNGIILGVSEALSCFIAVWMLRKFHHKAVFFFTLTLGVLTTITINYTPQGVWTYMLLLSILIGISGAGNIGFILVELCVDPKILGAALEMCCCLGVCSSFGTSIVAQAEMPVPVIMFLFFWIMGLVSVYYLPKGGRYLHKVEQINDSITRGEFDLYVVNDTVLEGASNCHAATYNELFIENK